MKITFSRFRVLFSIIAVVFSIVIFSSVVGLLLSRPIVEKSSHELRKKPFLDKKLQLYSKAQRLRVLIAGDSLAAYVLEISIQKKVPDDFGWAVDVMAVPGSGLSYPKFYDWIVIMEKRANEVKLAHRPLEDVICFLLGTNDGQAIALIEEHLVFGSESWEKEYVLRLERLLRAAQGSSKHIVWITPPPMKDEQFHKTISRIADIQKKVLANYPDVFVMDTNILLGDQDGQYLATKYIDGKAFFLRYDDGIHLYFDGADLLVDNLIKFCSVYYKYNENH